MASSETIFGINAVSVRLMAGGSGVHRLLLREGKLNARLSEIEAMAHANRIPVERIPEAELSARTAVSHQGVGLVVNPEHYLDESVLKDLLVQGSSPALLLVLDGVTDPRNFGACLRSAATLGVTAVIVPKDRSAPLGPAAIKTASGGASIVPVVRVVNISRCLATLKKQGVWVVGTLLQGAQDLDTIDLKGPTAIVMGSEESGIRRNTADQCDFLARIPMIVDDLGFNVSVATGICLYEAQRQRRTGS
ncbi:MAG: 23S rRNA (guanosine(2251)-2'-O)-methyltransferase RlmB [Pseudomonadales bacterium]|nr:23S rRNA (guanosine(2251)-2'-O)-methyltransferase RlmB [Pseudomonadales bacterium]